MKQNGRIIRGLWGIKDDSHRILKRRYRMDNNLKTLLSNKFYNTLPPAIDYVWGIENFNYLKALGLPDVRLVCKDPYQFALKEEQYRHKGELLRIAMEDDGYDTILHLDYDIYPTKPFPKDIWEVMSRKESLQGNLQNYKHRKCNWREEDSHTVINGGALYIRDKTIPSQIIKTWEGEWNDNKKSYEPALMKWLDEKYGKWIGKDEYRRLHELEVIALRRNPVFKKDTNDYCMIHYAGGG